MIKAEEMLKTGISLPDFESFADTDNGGAFIKESCYTTWLPAGKVLSVPWGYVCLPIFYNEKASETKWGHMMDNNTWSKTCIQQCGDMSLAAVQAWNVNHMSAAQGKCGLVGWPTSKSVWHSTLKSRPLGLQIDVV